MFKLNKDENRLEAVMATSFYESELKERQHIEEWLRKNPEVMGEELLIIGHEYDKFEVNERLDLLAIDKDGNLVIIEVKRDTSGSNVDFQALKYASYCSRLTPQDILEIYTEYINKQGLEVDPIQELVSFLECEDETSLNNMLNKTQRIVIIGKDFDKRILSVCSWLYENDINIKCISITPFSLFNEIIVDINQIIPPEKLENYYINKKVKSSHNSIKINHGTVELLKIVADKINTLIDSKVYYQGTKPYFGAGKIQGKPISFIVSYSKRLGALGFGAESSKELGTRILRELFQKKINLINKELDLELELDAGVKNKSWYRLHTKIALDNNIDINEQVDKFAETFIKFKELIEITINELEQ